MNEPGYCGDCTEAGKDQGGWFAVQLCPKHAATDKLADLLQRTLDAIENLLYGGMDYEMSEDRDKRVATEALARALLDELKQEAGTQIPETS